MIISAERRVKTIEAVIEFAEVTITIFMLLRIKELEKKVNALEKEQPTLEKIAIAFAKNLSKNL